MSISSCWLVSALGNEPIAHNRRAVRRVCVPRCGRQEYLPHGLVEPLLCAPDSRRGNRWAKKCAPGEFVRIAQPAHRLKHRPRERRRDRRKGNPAANPDGAVAAAFHRGDAVDPAHARCRCIVVRIGLRLGAVRVAGRWRAGPAARHRAARLARATGSRSPAGGCFTLAGAATAAVRAIRVADAAARRGSRTAGGHRHAERGQQICDQRQAGRQPALQRTPGESPPPVAHERTRLGSRRFRGYATTGPGPRQGDIAQHLRYG